MSQLVPVAVLAQSVARYLAYSVGEGKQEEIRKWFTSAVGLHFGFAGVLTLIGWPVGEYLIRQVLLIPPFRIEACLWVFRASLVSAFWSMLSIPYIAMFRAKQRLIEPAIWRVMQAAVTFALSLWLLRAPGDLLIVYSVGVAGIWSLIQVIQIFRAIIRFPESRLLPRYMVDLRRFRALGSFATWTLFGSTGWLIRNQGSAVLLNLVFGPSINGAYGIANQVSTQASQLSNSLLSAIGPEVVSSEARGERARMIRLCFKACKLGAILTGLISVPVIFEMDTILVLWLKSPPAHTVEICQLIIISFLFDRLTSGCVLGINAHGKIATYQMSVGLAHLLTLPILWLFISRGGQASSVGLAFIVSIGICTIVRLYWFRRLLGASIWSWVSEVLLPILWTCLFMFLLAGVVCLWMNPSGLRMVVTFLFSIGGGVFAGWRFGLNSSERMLVFTASRKVLGKIGLRGFEVDR